ncbi:uncharacterized protein LOC115359119 isoform X2 [Myripristis murdjan]|uniref:uncharacterized protein LOC115359119 isoform X2 n=1 Tax=Myripristis murdjan TaxID=586833 RepID=UPI001175FA1D|nr:uncharacterized protein LOC115359119 isoform X2 [Myripristis murdjan]
MSNTKLQLFRSFLTERLTAVAVEIFGEVESMVEGYCEENRRLQDLLNMVLSPELKLHRIDHVKQATAAAAVHEQPSEQIADLDLVKPEPWFSKIKEEQIEYETSPGEQPPQGFEGAEALNFDTAVLVKTDTEEDLNSHHTSNPFNIQVVEFKSESSSSTITADEEDAESGSESYEDMEASTDDLPLSGGSHDRCSNCSGCDECGENSKKKVKRPLQKTMLEFPRMMHHKSFSGKLTDCRPFLSRLSDAFSDIPDDKKPLIAKMGLSENVEMVDCAFGKVPKGCPLSYQCPVPSSRDYSPHWDAPPLPSLPLAAHKLEPVAALPALTAREQEHLNALQTSWDAAYALELSTREVKESVEELRRARLTDRFREICHLKPGTSHVEHLIFKMQKGTKDQDKDKDQMLEALREYCKQVFVNWSPCGLVVHPDAPWLAAVPDGLVYDPSETHNYGLVHVRCPQIRSFVNSQFLDFQRGALELRKNHAYYWQIQGEMMVTGTDWCDLVVYTQEDILVQRVYRNTAMIKPMKEKLDRFFFHYYLPSLTSV